jgi:hypothetical protein
MKKPEKRLPYRTAIHKCIVTMPIDDGALVEPEAFIREGTEYMLSLFEESGEKVLFAKAVLEIVTKVPDRH